MNERDRLLSLFLEIRKINFEHDEVNDHRHIKQSELDQRIGKRLFTYTVVPKSKELERMTSDNMEYLVTGMQALGWEIDSVCINDDRCDSNLCMVHEMESIYVWAKFSLDDYPNNFQCRVDVGVADYDYNEIYKAVLKFGDPNTLFDTGPNYGVADESIWRFYGVNGSDTFCRNINETIIEWVKSIDLGESLEHAFSRGLYCPSEKLYAAAWWGNVRMLEKVLKEAVDQNREIHCGLNVKQLKTVLDMSFARQQFADVEFLAVDVDYRDNIGHVAGVSFFDRNLSWGTDTDREGENRTHTTVVEKVEGYKSGEFYKRELPCIKALLEEHNLTPDCIIVDGFVHLEGGKPGMGKYLFDALDGNIPVIGVAKNPMGTIHEKHEVIRGKSVKPLFVTSEGIGLGHAKYIVSQLDGKYRIPNNLRLADRLCREIGL